MGGLKLGIAFGALALAVSGVAAPAGAQIPTAGGLKNVAATCVTHVPAVGLIPAHDETFPGLFPVGASAPTIATAGTLVPVVLPSTRYGAGATLDIEYAVTGGTLMADSAVALGSATVEGIPQPFSVSASGNIVSLHVESTGRGTLGLPDVRFYVRAGERGTQITISAVSLTITLAAIFPDGPPTCTFDPAANTVATTQVLAPPTISVDNPTAHRPVNAHDKESLTFTVSLSTMSSQMVRVWITTSKDPSRPQSYTDLVHKMLVFKPGETTKSVTVKLMYRSKNNTDATVTATLSDPMNATIGGGGIGTITHALIP